ncbi:hypothetical protein B0H16DRAFT_1885288 [Mycena metata]|uniref:Uncharacterized protein n=1 Tax=Mycena metata TaxID=1033252 RepID=A0AAD7J789_9AGAR|nr:hypothetical protein B0H16DRAFT_1885288 [Mycena metata]
MPRLAKSQPKASTKAAVRVRERSENDFPELLSMIDNEARDSDGDGILVDPADVNAGSDSEGYEPDFIDDRDHDTAVAFGTPELTPAPEIPLTQRNPGKESRIPRKAQSVAVIELESSDEDLERMAVDDSMYRKPAGVKAAYICSSSMLRYLITFQGVASFYAYKEVGAFAPYILQPLDVCLASSKRINDSTKIEGDEPDKKKYKTASSNSAPTAKSAIPFDEAAMTKFMAAFMVEYMKSKADEDTVQQTPSLRRIDFDQVALQKGLAASRAESKKVESSSSGVKPGRRSPDWDLVEMDADADCAAASSKRDKGKGKLKERLADIKDVDDVFQAAPADASLERSVAKQGAAHKSQTDNFVIKKKTVASPVSAAKLAHKDPNLTMAQYFKENSAVVVAGVADEAADSSGDDVDPPSTVFLEDLENYKAFYDPDAPCGVFDPDLQDPALALTYRKLPPLPGGRQLLPVYDPTRGVDGSADSDVKGGRAKFSSWRRHLKTMLANNCIGAMLFVEGAPAFINLSRVSPLRLSKQASSGASATQRLLVDGKVAVCVSAIFCTDSMIISAGKIGTKTERTRKWISGILHNQDWERFESVVCLVFGEDVMYTQINNKKALAFQTMISPDSASGGKDSDVQFSKIAPADMFSPVVSTTPVKARASTSKISPSKAKTLLAHNDFLPVFDARKTVVDFSTDLGRLTSVLPAFTGEIPFSSFVVVGYSVSAYSSALSGTTQRVPHVGCNVLWAIVCGTPVLRH